MESIMLFFQLLLYILGATALAVIIVLVVKLIYTIDKTNEILDEVDSKVKSLNGLFEVLNSISTGIVSIKEKVFDRIIDTVSNVTKKNKKKKEKKIDE